MKITFELEGNQKVNIMADNKKIGHIFTPAGTCEDKKNAIQICGFDEAFDLWACGLFNDINGNPKKDIQLMFSKNSFYFKDPSNINRDIVHCDFSTDCLKCFRPKCSCDCKNLIVKKSSELSLEFLSQKEKDDKLTLERAEKIMNDNNCDWNKAIKIIRDDNIKKLEEKRKHENK